jgi:hypothetical protein
MQRPLLDDEAPLSLGADPNWRADAEQLRRSSQGEQKTGSASVSDAGSHNTAADSHPDDNIQDLGGVV